MWPLSEHILIHQIWIKNRIWAKLHLMLVHHRYTSLIGVLSFQEMDKMLTNIVTCDVKGSEKVFFLSLVKKIVILWAIGLFVLWIWTSHSGWRCSSKHVKNESFPCAINRLLTDLQDLWGALFLQHVTKVKDTIKVGGGNSRDHTLPMQGHLQGHLLASHL